MLEYTDDYANFVTVSPPPVEREDKNSRREMHAFANFPEPDSKAGIPNFEHANVGQEYPDYPPDARQEYDMKQDQYDHGGFSHVPELRDLDGSLLSPNSSSSYDQFGLAEQRAPPENPGFLFSNPNPEISSLNLLNPNYPFYQGHTEYATSAYSEASLNANVPFHDAASHFTSSAPLSNFGGYDNKDSYFDSLPTQLQRDSFSQEISLGQSISTTNLLLMNFQQSMDLSALQQNFQDQNYHDQNLASLDFQGFQLTENNLLSYNENQVTISIQEPPEAVARKTPSLFSNSSHNSLKNENQQSLQRPEVYPSLPSTPGGNSPVLSLNSPYDSAVSESQYLNPDDFQNVRRGRQTAHSRKVHSRSNSRSSRSNSRTREDASSGADTSDYDSDYDEKDKPMSSREKMLELANAPVVTKRAQIHPSLYACTLCEKRFTRPYNLKSHLRTHTDERPYICNICGKAFARQHDKKRHEELHSGEKKFQCKGLLKDGTEFGCSRKFARADALRRHFQTEAGKECIRLLVEEEKASQNAPDNLNSGIQLPDGKFMNSYFLDIPMVSVQSPEGED